MRKIVIALALLAAATVRAQSRSMEVGKLTVSKIEFVFTGSPSGETVISAVGPGGVATASCARSDALVLADTVLKVTKARPERAAGESLRYSILCGMMMVERLITDRGDELSVAIGARQQFYAIRVTAAQADSFAALIGRAASAYTATPAEMDSIGDGRQIGALFDFQVEKPAQPFPSNPDPVYPESLRARKIGGSAILSFVVDASGKIDPTSIRVLRTDSPQFAGAAREVLPRLRFYPAEVGGQKVRQLVQMPFVFTAPPTH